MVDQRKQVNAAEEQDFLSALLGGKQNLSSQDAAAPIGQSQEDDEFLGALLGSTPRSSTAVAAPAPVPEIAVEPDFADYVGASAENLGIGFGTQLFAPKRMVYNLTYDYFLEHTEEGKQFMEATRFIPMFQGSDDFARREAVKQYLIDKFEFIPRLFGPTRVAFQVEDYLTKKLRKDFESRPREVQEALPVQVSGAVGQIAATAGQAAIPVVGPGLAAASAGAAAFNDVYQEARQGGATMGDAVVGAAPSAAAAAVLEPLGAKAATGVGKVLNRWNSKSGGAVEKMLDGLAKKAGTEATKRITTKAGEEALEVGLEKVTGDVAKAAARPFIGSYATAAGTRAVGRVGYAGAVNFFGEAMEKVLANAGVNYATDEELSLLRGVLDEGVVGGSAGAFLRTVVETIAGVRARRGPGAKVDLSPKVGDTPLFTEDGDPIKVSEALSGITPEERLTRETQAVSDAATEYSNQIIATRGQKDAPNYIPETVSVRELAIVISNERKVDMATAMQAAEKAKALVADRLVGEPLEPVFEPTVDPTDPMTWGSLGEAEVTALYDREYSDYVQKLEDFQAKLERRAEVAATFGSRFLGGVDDLDELRLRAANENARFWSEMYGDPERGVSTERGPKGNKVSIPRTTVAKLQTIWQKLFNEEYALELLEQDVESRGQIELATVGRNRQAAEVARTNIELYKQMLADEYRYFPTLNPLYESGAERNMWMAYLAKQRDFKAQSAIRATLHAQNLQKETEKRVEVGERMGVLLAGVDREAKQRADEYRRAMEAQFEPEPAPRVSRPPAREFAEPKFTPSLDPTKSETWGAKAKTEEEAIAVYESEQAQFRQAMEQYRRRQEQRTKLAGEIGAGPQGPRTSAEAMMRRLRGEPPSLLPPPPKTKKEQKELEQRQAEYLEAMGQYVQPESAPEPAPEPAPAPAPAPTPAPAAPTAPPLKLDFTTAAQKKVLAEIVDRAEEYLDNQDLIDQYGKDTLDQLVEGLGKPTVEIPAAALELFRDTVEEVINQNNDALERKLYEKGEGISRRGLQSFLAAANMLYDALPAAAPQAATAPAPAPTTAPAPAAPTATPTKQKLSASNILATNIPGVGPKKVFKFGEREFVVVDVDGVPTLFYLSSGENPKEGVSEGKWYPTPGFSREEGGELLWILKTSDIGNFYGSQRLREASEMLNSEIGDQRNKVEGNLAIRAIENGLKKDERGRSPKRQISDAVNELTGWTVERYGAAATRHVSNFRSADKAAFNQHLAAWVAQYSDGASAAHSAAELDPAALAPAAAPTTAPEPQSQIDAQIQAMLDPASTKKFVFVADGSPQPTAKLVTSSTNKVYVVNLTGEKGGMRGTLYTTDLGLSMSARRRAQSEGGVTEVQLDQYLYNRSQGKPKDPGAVVVQRRDQSGNVVVERASDPADAPAVAGELAAQVPSGITTVVTPADAVSEREARSTAETQLPPAATTPVAVRLGVVKSVEVANAALGAATGAKGGQADVFAALANSGSPQSIDQLVAALPVKPGKAVSPSEHRVAIADALSRLVELGYVVQQTAPDGRTYSALSVEGEQKFSSAAKTIQSAAPSSIPPKGRSFEDLIRSESLTRVERYVLQEIEARRKRRVAESFADLQSKGSLTNFSVDQVEAAVRSLVSKNLVALERFASGTLIKLSPSFEAKYDAELAKTRQHQLASNREAVAKKLPRPFPSAFEGPGIHELFDRPSRVKPELPFAPKAEPTVGRVMPGVDVWKSRVEAALRSNPSGPMEFISHQELSMLDPTVQETQDAIRGASDADLERLLESDTPVGFRRIATEMAIDPVTGMEVVSKVEAALVQFDKKAVSRESWMVNRQLAWIEMRRRAQQSQIDADLGRSARAATKFPPKPGAPYMRPRDPMKMRSGDPDMPSGYVRAPNGKMVPVFEDINLGMTVSMEPATSVPGDPVNIADIRDALNDVFNHIALPLVPDVGVKGVEGVYDPAKHAAVVGMTWDFGTISHELSHGMVAWLHSTGVAGPEALVATMSPEVVAEVTKLGRDLYGSRVPAGGYEHEGFAEFFRMWMIGNESAAANYPSTYKWFHRTVLPRDSVLAEKLSSAQQLIDQFRFQGAEAHSRGVEVSREQRRKRIPLLKRLSQAMYWTRFMQTWFSDIQSIRDMSLVARENAVRLKKMTYDEAANDVALNAGDYVQGLRSQASLLMRKWVTQHMTTADGRTILEGSQSLDQAMDPMRGHRDDLMEYMRLMREEWLATQDEPRLGPTNPVVRRTRLAELRAKHGDRIVLAHDNVHRWIKNVIAYCRTNSDVFDKAFSDIDASGDTESWVPLQRLVYDVMVPPSMALGDLQQFTDPSGVSVAATQRSRLRSRATEGALVGGISPTYNVLEQLESNLNSLLAMTHKHMMIKAVLKLANENPVLRGYAHKVRGAREVLTSPTSPEMDPILSLGDNAALMNMQAMRSMPDVNNDDRVIMTFPVVNADGDIELETYSLHKVVADAFGSLVPSDIVRAGQAITLLDKLARLSVGITKTTATGILNPVFQLVIGPIMDFQTIWVNGTYPMGGFKLFYDYPMRYLALAAEAIVEPLGGPFVTKGTKLEREMNVGFESLPTLASGKQSYFKSVGLSKGQSVVRKLSIWNGDLLRILERMTSFPSKAGRQLSSEQAARNAGWDGKSALSQSQAVAFVRGYDRTAVNWKEQGKWTRVINRYVEYFGVPLAANRDFLRLAKDQLANPRTRTQFGLKMAAQLGLAVAWWVLYDDEDEIKNLSYEEKSTKIPLPVPMADGSVETLLVPKAQSELFMFSMMQAYLESKSTTDPNFWSNRGKAFVAAQLPSFLPGAAELLLQGMGATEEDSRKALVDMLMPEAGYELSRPIVDQEKYMTPSQMMSNPYGTITGQKLAEISNGGINPRKFDAMVSAVSGQSVQRFEQALVMMGLADDTRPVSARGSVANTPVFGRLFAARSGVTMRSPHIRTLYALQENLLRQLRAIREGELGSDIVGRFEAELRLANQEAAARNGWATVMCINYVAQYAPDLTTKQRQDMMDYAGVVAESAVAAIYNGGMAPVYDPKQTRLPGYALPVETMRNVVEMQQPDYKPTINLPKTFGVPFR